MQGLPVSYYLLEHTVKYKAKTEEPVSEARLRRVKKDSGTWGEVQRMLDEAGLPMPVRPTEDMGPPLLPEDLTAISDETLMDFFLKYVRWSEYVAMQAVRSGVMAKEAEHQLGIAQQTALQRNWSGTKEDRVTIAKAARDTDPAVLKLTDEYMKRDAYARALGTLNDGVERKVSLVSRELTRRTSIEPHERRAHRWGGA